MYRIYRDTMGANTAYFPDGQVEAPHFSEAVKRFFDSGAGSSSIHPDGERVIVQYIGPMGNEQEVGGIAIFDVKPNITRLTRVNGMTGDNS